MGVISIVFGIINQLITGGAPPCIYIYIAENSGASPSKLGIHLGKAPENGYHRLLWGFHHGTRMKYWTMGISMGTSTGYQWIYPFGCHQARGSLKKISPN